MTTPFSVDSITLGDIEMLEQHGVSLTDMASVAALDPTSGQMPPARVLIGLAWLLGRVDNPERTMDDYKTMTLDQLMELTASIETPGAAELD